MGEPESAIASLHQEINEYMPPSQRILKSRFRAWHVEALLNQAVELLDRCMAERRELQALNTKRAEEGLKLTALVTEANVMKERCTNGWYAVSLNSFKNSHIDLGAWEAALKEGHEEALRLVAEAPGPSHAKNVTQKSATAAWHKAVTERVERQDRAAADEKDLCVVNKSISATVGNAKAAEAAHAFPGPLYFDDQIRSLHERILDDFKDAYDRLSVASQGLKLFYGYSKPLPVRADPKGSGTYSLSLLDTTSLWARAAVRWMVATLQYEQVFSLNVSVRASVSQHDWNAALDDIKNNGSAKFYVWIDSGLVSAHRYIRFRGVAGFCAGSSDMWSARVSLPRRAVSVQSNDAGEYRLEINQSELPSCILGRVLSRDNPREPELGGVNSLRNLSIFGFSEDDDGRLLVTVSKAFGAFNSVEASAFDLQLEFLLAGLPSGQPNVSNGVSGNGNPYR